MRRKQRQSTRKPKVLHPSCISSARFNLPFAPMYTNRKQQGRYMYALEKAQVSNENSTDWRKKQKS